MMRSASLPTATTPRFRPWTRAVFPVAKDTATSGGTPPKAAAQEMVRSTPRGTTPVPAGESVPTSTRSRAPALCGERDDLTACLDVAVVDHLDGHIGLVDDPFDVAPAGAPSAHH